MDIVRPDSFSGGSREGMPLFGHSFQNVGMLALDKELQEKSPCRPGSCLKCKWWPINKGRNVLDPAVPVMNCSVLCPSVFFSKGAFTLGFTASAAAQNISQNLFSGDSFRLRFCKSEFSEINNEISRHFFFRAAQSLII
ncbi:hypothetical protein CEXT_651471 [Caerostris extrusa]|uniref:Uncharacterized protein n=1 Tax=Caerostris extrusa TaxID=172846 RepID=A0AAV4T5R5_CAEEX|nr:hypothetical protein CEXT_651471 [Caerostris extrusa]